MHSTEILRGNSFELHVDGEPVAHADYFHDVTKTSRLGLVAPNRIDGVGAVNLLMATITAFYDRYRADGGEFYTYPDVFTFQPAPPLAAYGMLDVHPPHKSVAAGTTPDDVLQSITDRGVHTLIVPDAKPGSHDFDSVALVSARRNITQCYAYAFEGQVDGADVVIRCASSPIDEWVETVFEGFDEHPELMKSAQAWLDRCRGNEILEQSYRRIDLNEALARMCGSSELAAV